MTRATNGHTPPAPEPPPPAPTLKARKARAPRAPEPAKPSRTPKPAKPDPGASVTLALSVVADAVHAMLPASASIKERAAVDYWGASVAAQYAESWRNKAKKIALITGALPDTVFPIGTAETVYAGSLVTIGLKVVEQASRVDVAGLVADLESAGVSSKVLKRLVDKHTKVFAGAHVFSAGLNG